MSDPEPNVETCSVCRTGELRQWEELEVWSCKNCSYVFNRKRVDTSVNPIQETSEVGESSQEEKQDWKKNLKSHDRSEANLIDVLSKTEDLAEEFELPEEVEVRAGELVTDAWRSNFMLGRTKTATVGAAVYVAAREGDQAIPPAFIAESLELEKRRIKDVYTSLKKELDVTLTGTTPQEFVPAISDELEVNDEVEHLALELLDKTGLMGGNPVGIAAAAVYKASSVVGAQHSQREIAAIVDMTKETIWRHSKEFEMKKE